MTNVIDLRARRKSETFKATGATYTGEDHYYCLNCHHSEAFKLYASGRIHCATCGMLMRNLAVSFTKPKGAA